MSLFRERVNLEFSDGIARVRLQRADKRNALDLDMFDAIVDAQKAIGSMPGVRVVIIEADGEDFCSGLDVKSIFRNKSSPVRLLWKWWPWASNLAQKVSTGWRKLPLPVIASIQGRCWGGGLQIALGADFRLVHEDASLSIMEGKWGLIPDMGGTLALCEIMPRDQAMRLAMTAEIITAQQALELGLATVLTRDLAKAGLELSQALMERSPDALAGVKKLYLNSWHSQQGTILARESLYQAKVLAGKNQRIAVRRQMGEDVPYRLD